VSDDGNNGGGIVEDKKGNDIIIPESYNYIGVFLTFACQLRCGYCINHEKKAQPCYLNLRGKTWVKNLNRIGTRSDLPITLQGGEPTMHPDFYEIVNGINKDIELDLLTNCQFNIDEFCEKVSPDRFKRNAPYASIRVSFHPTTMELVDTITRIKCLKDRSYSVGVWIVNHPDEAYWIQKYQQAFMEEGIDCRLKEYLDGDKYGTYKYKEIQGRKNVLCKPTELLIAPNGDIHRCHGDLYNNRTAYGNICNSDVKLVEEFIPCKKVACNSCDCKVKYDRFQIPGHCAVTIKENINE
jgi:sulfatase maturation enzyme AslB (radical SAM superfamily)